MPPWGIGELRDSAARLPANALLFFDDREPNVVGARLAGWRAEHIDPARDVAGQLLDHLRHHSG